MDIKPDSVQKIGKDLFLYCSGLGSRNATRAARTLIDLDIDALASWGVAGALDSNLAAGDILLPAKVIDTIDRQRHKAYEVDKHWHAALRSALGRKGVYSEGSIVSTQVVQDTPRKKTALHRATEAMAVDMESAAIARVASEAGKPFVVIRSISDTVAMSLPASALDAIDQYAQVSLSRLFGGLLKNPGDLAHYPILFRSFKKAEKRLRQVLELCGNDLLWPPSVERLFPVEHGSGQ